MTVYSFPDRGKEISYRDSQFILVNDILETMAQVGKTQMAYNKSWSVSVHDGDAAKMSRVKCEWWEEKCGRSMMCV